MGGFSGIFFFLKDFIKTNRIRECSSIPSTQSFRWLRPALQQQPTGMNWPLTSRDAYFLEMLCNGHVWKRVWCRCLWKEACGGSTTTSRSWRPLLSPDRHNNSVHAGCSCGYLGAPPPLVNISLPTYCVCNFYTGIRACLVDNVFINFFTDLWGRSGFFSFFETIFMISFLVLPWWLNDLENFVENLLHLAIDQLSVCPNTARRELWPWKWFLFDRSPWR